MVNEAIDLGWGSLSLGGFGLLIAATVIFSIFRGWLVPGKTVRELIATKDQAIEGLREERNDWRETARLGQKAVTTQNEQMRELQQALEVTVALMQALTKAVESDHSGRK